MAETPLTAAQANALSGTTDSDTADVYQTIGESTYYTTDYRLTEKMLRMIKPAGNSLRVYQDGDLTFGVRAGHYYNGSTLVTYAGATAQALTNNLTNYIYLTAAGTLTKNTSGFPSPALTPHIPLATILTASGTYLYTAITDYRDRALFSVLDGMSAGDVQDSLPLLTMTGVDSAGGAGTMTIQLTDLGGNELAQRTIVRTWLNLTAEFGAPGTTTDYSVSTGTQIEEVTANGQYVVQSDATGEIVMAINAGGADTVYLQAEVNGKVYAETLIISA